MVNRLVIFVLIGMLLLWSSVLTMAYAVDNNCKITIAHLVEMPIALGCIEDRLDVLENKPVQSGSENTSASNLGNGQGVFAQEVGDNLQFKSLGAGSGVSLQSNSTVILINSTSVSDNTVCANVGTGSQVYKDGECNFRTVLGSPDISVTQQTNTITIDYNSTDYLKVIQVLCDVRQQLTKTNLATTYTDMYITAFDEENKCAGTGGSVIDFTNVTHVIIYYQVDFVGAGTNQYRWVDSNNNNNILFESATSSGDCDVCNSGFFVKPSWLTGTVGIEWQGKSSNGTNDPIIYGYTIQVK